MEGVFVRIVEAFETRDGSVEAGAVLFVSAALAAELVETGVAVPERTDTPNHSRETRTGGSAT